MSEPHVIPVTWDLNEETQYLLAPEKSLNMPLSEFLLNHKHVDEKPCTCPKNIDEREAFRVVVKLSEEELKELLLKIYNKDESMKVIVAQYLLK